MSDPQTPLLPMPWNTPPAAPSPLLPQQTKGPIPPPATAPAPATPAGPEDKLTPADRDILADYRAKYAEREARYAKCQEQAQADQARRDEEQAQIDADWNDKSKKHPKKKPKPKTSVRECKLEEGRIACVPADKPPRGTMSEDLTKIINKEAGTSVDLAKISQWEGGVHLNAYQPWFPDLTRNADGSYSAALSKDGTYLQGPIVKGTKYPNASGVTIAKGVDLGPQNKDPFLSELVELNKQAKILTPEELEQLKTKLGPYFGLRRAAACAYLRANPLSITQKEADLLNYRAAKEAMKQATTIYKKETGNDLSALSPEAQTVILSRAYQSGRIPDKAVLDNLAAGNYATASTSFDPKRERPFLAALGNAPPPASTAPATPSAGTATPPPKP
ncbi:pesticin C-terminus-like muramidase [Tahibacter harae]|uniref:Pesticin C-terminus-like muramidase n=1 Tax=Tahibacter harae TaxID=2963937 RepID=A0ABT1QV88_9GAMM|nr:pesticin C-terminus-like muramidase [Tahibacter harae]MCQ4166204.1 pesticin C-terminus-like muramidase [Tahibacter harae]